MNRWWLLALLVLFVLCFPLLTTLIDLIKILWTLVHSKLYSDDPQAPEGWELPKVIHQIAFYKGKDIPEQWRSCKDFWKEYNPDWTVKTWNEDMADKLITQEYPWLWDVYNSYSNIVQKVDMIRLIILHKHGGIYSDLDVCAKKSMNELIHYDFGMILTTPHGYSNFFMVSKANHPILLHFLSQFRLYNRFWFLPYLKVMCSTGPFLLTYLMHTYPFQDQIRRLPDHWSTREYTSFRFGSSWHEWDSTLLIGFYEHLYLCLFILAVIILCIIRCCHKNVNHSPLLPFAHKHHSH